MSTELPALMSERQGRYRSRVMPLPLTVCRHLVWRAVGDPVAVADLLAPIAAIGKSAAPAMATSCPGTSPNDRAPIGRSSRTCTRTAVSGALHPRPACARSLACGPEGRPNGVAAALHASCSSNSDAAAVALKDITMTAQVNSYLFMPRNYGRS